MGLAEYEIAREFLGTIGQPIITYILIISLFQGIFSILYFIKKDSKYSSYILKCFYILTGLYFIGFIILGWFHLQIYNSVLIQYPAGIKEMIPVEESRIAVPLWIESEKLYFWATCAYAFALTVKGRKEMMSFLGVVLSIFSGIVFFFSNPFKDPLPILNGEIMSWYQALPSSDYSIFQISGTLYSRITYYYNSTYMWTHPPMLFIAYASLIITFAACVLMLFRKDRQMEETAYNYAKIGYILLTTGMLIGYPWAIEAWKDSAWWWDPKISGSIMMWVLYSAYLHSRIYVSKGKMWRTTAYIGIICFASLIFTYLLTYIVPGIHSMVQP